MTNQELIQQATRVLAGQSLPTPYLDAVLLLSFQTGKSKEALLSDLPNEASQESASGFFSLVERRCAGEPVSYIRGIKEFFGITFRVDRRVLVPRPETELLLELALSPGTLLPSARVHDLCTGSGCLSIALKMFRPDLRVTASDLSEDALQMFRLNCRLHGQDIPVFRSDLFAEVHGPFEAILCNPPYVESGEVDLLMASRWPEPRMALDGGPDGLALIRRLIPAALDELSENGYLFMEASPRTAENAALLASEAGFSSCRIIPDGTGRDRVLAARR